MTKTKILNIVIKLSVFTIIFMMSGCERDIDILEPADFPATAEIFLDGFSAGLNYAAFGGSRVDAFQVDDEVKFKGTQSMRIAVPNAGDPKGAYAGGAYFTSAGRDLTGYDALTFWAKATKGATIDVLGFGNDLSGASNFIATRLGMKVSTIWEKYIIPIPLASKLVAERGMFFFSEGPENDFGYNIWFDEVKFEKLGTLAHPKPAILETQDQSINAQVGDNLPIGGTFVTYNLPDGTDQRVDASLGYFTFSSSDENVATVDEKGVVSVVGLGSVTITAKLGEIDAAGSLTVKVSEAPAGPTVKAPTPTVPAGDVISLYSNAYTNVTVDTWSAEWDEADVVDLQVEGDDVKFYSNLNFAGIEFTSNTIDASSMTHFHMDIWTPDETTPPATFKIKLVDFGADGAFGGGDDTEHEISLDQNTTPAIGSNAWVGLDIPLTDFTNLTNKASLAQMIISGDPNNVYVDNVYLHGSGGGGSASEPTEPAPTPTQDANNVVSLYSNAYTNVNIDTWSAEWDVADLEDIQISGNDAKLYTNLSFAGIESTSEPIDASAMTYFHMDFWTPDPTAVPAVFKIKLVDFGADGAFDGSDDVEHEIILDATTNPAIATGSWVGLDIPLTDFVNLSTKGHIAQMIISGDPNTVYVDNVYFYGEGGGGTATEPTGPAPTPTFSQDDVVSLFSNSYTDVNVDTWSADWDVADLEDTQINGDDVKLYTNLSFAGIEFTSQTIDASTMTHFYLDFWTPDPTGSPAALRIKLVDFGADGAFQGGDDVEHEITLDATTTPAIGTGSWITFDIPLSEFAGLSTTGHLAQLIISGDPNTVYIDNVIFHK